MLRRLAITIMPFLSLVEPSSRNYYRRLGRATENPRSNREEGRRGALGGRNPPGLLGTGPFNARNSTVEEPRWNRAAGPPPGMPLLGKGRPLWAPRVPWVISGFSTGE